MEGTISWKKLSDFDADYKLTKYQYDLAIKTAEIVEEIKKEHEQLEKYSRDLVSGDYGNQTASNADALIAASCRPKQYIQSSNNIAKQAYDGYKATIKAVCGEND